MTTRLLLFASLGPGVFRNLILRAVREAFERLGAATVRNRLKSMKSKVNVHAVSAQRAALASNGLQDGTIPLAACVLVPFPTVMFPERCGRSMRFVGEVQPPPGLVGLTGGRESG